MSPSLQNPDPKVEPPAGIPMIPQAQSYALSTAGVPTCFADISQPHAPERPASDLIAASAQINSIDSIVFNSKTLDLSDEHPSQAAENRTTNTINKLRIVILDDTQSVQLTSTH